MTGKHAAEPTPFVYTGTAYGYVLQSVDSEEASIGGIRWNVVQLAAWSDLGMEIAVGGPSTVDYEYYWFEVPIPAELEGTDGEAINDYIDDLVWNEVANGKPWTHVKQRFVIAGDEHPGGEVRRLSELKAAT